MATTKRKKPKRRPETAGEKLAVKVARDVLKMLRVLRLEPGGYIDMTDDNANPMPSAVVRAAWADDLDLGQVVGRIAKDCTVCLLGACVLSIAKLVDNLPARKVFNRQGYGTFTGGDVYKYITGSGAFDKATANAMESAFELTPMYSDPYDSKDTLGDRCRGAVRYVIKCRTPADRVKRVMLNVIDNGGRFVVRPLTLGVWCSENWAIAARDAKRQR